MLLLPALLLYASLVKTVYSLSLNVSTPRNTHFRSIGYHAGTMGMAHIRLRTNVSEQIETVARNCELPDEMLNQYGVNMTRGQRNMLTSMQRHCQMTLEQLRERELVWWNDFEAARKMGKRRARALRKEDEVPLQTLNEENPYVKAPPRTRRQAAVVAGLLGLGGLVAGISALYATNELKAMVHDVERQQNCRWSSWITTNPGLI